MPLHVADLGDPRGEPLICLHGLTGHGRRFARLARTLDGRRIVAPDLRGHGRSPWEPPWTTEQHVEDVLASVPAGRCDWLGFSFGTRIALACAQAAPDRVRRLVLLDPALTLPAGDCLTYAEEMRPDESWATEDGFIATVTESPFIHHTPRDILEEEARDHLERREDGRLRERYCRSMGIAAWSEMARAAPPQPDVPTLLVLGERSWIRPHARGTRTVTVPGGHSVLWDAFDETARAVAGFLDSGAP